MGTRRGAEYLAALEDGREVWLAGERVDVASHSMLASFARALAETCDRGTIRRLSFGWRGGWEYNTRALGTRRPYPTARLLDGQPRGILFDAAKCIGCRQCVEACKDWNDLPRGNYFAINDSTWLAMMPAVPEGQGRIWGRKSCMHCEFPLCAAVCPVEAITKYEEGPVVIDQAKCIGCEYCIHACPWHVIAKDHVSGKSTKCTMCSDRLAQGEMPFCVQACPVQALEFGPLADMEAKAQARAQELDARVYGEKEAGGTHVVNLLTASPAEHGMPLVARERYPRHHVPLRTKVLGLFTFTGGLDGKRRAVSNALTKPWRLKYRYWHRPGA